jgi:hypothetical protein
MSTVEPLKKSATISSQLRTGVGDGGALTTMSAASADVPTKDRSTAALARYFTVRLRIRGMRLQNIRSTHKSL